MFYRCSKKNNFGLNVESASFYCFGTVITKSLVKRMLTHFLRKTTAREVLFSSPSSEVSLPLSTVSELQSSASSSSSLEDDSSYLAETGTI